MGVRPKKSNLNPLKKANFIEKLFFWWLKDTLQFGTKNETIRGSIYDTMADDLSEPLRDDLEISWQDELSKAKQMNRKPNLWRAVIKTYYRDFFKYGLFQVCFVIGLTLQPLLLEMTMVSLDTKRATSLQAYVVVTVAIVVMFSQTALIYHSLFGLNRLGMQARIACSSLIFKKLTRLSCGSASRNTGSSIINLLSNDVARFEFLLLFLPIVGILPFQLFAVSGFIWRYVGPVPTVVGIALVILQTIPLQILYYKVSMKLRAKQATRTDKRISLIGEVVNGIRAIKMYVWENYFEKLVYQTRRLEIKGYAQVTYVTSAVWAFFLVTYRLCTFATVLIYVLQHGAISAEQLLPISQHFVGLQLSCVNLALSVWAIVDMRVSMKRIQDFLLLEEVDPNINQIVCDEDSVIISEVTAAWAEDNNENVLKDINLNVASKKLYAVIGPVGSGKSSLLKLILGELRQTSGEVSICGNLSYASQEPWLFTGSVRENIIFGRIYDEEWYLKVVEACALLDDFEQLPHGDKTLVGDRGISLSGGQCARINLARSVYKEADIYLFDDPLSAVDTKVAKILMNDCINGLLQNRTRILVTHNVHQLSDVDEIIVLQSGGIAFRGNLENLKETEQYLQFSINEEKDSEIKKIGDAVQADDEIGTTEINNALKSISDDEPKETEELLAKGAMSKSVYWRYTKFGGLRFMTILCILNILSVIFISAFDYGLPAWTRNVNISENQKSITSKKPSDFSHVKQWMLIFGGIIVSIAVISIWKNVFLYKFTLNASERLHNSMFKNLMNTPLRFFEVNPSGRVLNRFSEDTGNVDNALSQAMLGMIQMTFHAVGLLIPVLIVNWWYIFPVIFIAYLYYCLSMKYVLSTQKLKRMIGNAKSPVLSFVTSSLAGLMTIRSSHAEGIVCREFDSRLNRHTAVHFLALALNQGFSFWLEAMSYFLFAFVAYSSVALRSSDKFAGYVGISLLQLLNVTSLLSFTVRQIAEFMGQMTGVERMLQFTELEREVSGSESVKSWPSEGEIKFENVYLRYCDEAEPILKNLSFTVEPGTKVGVIGRTGAGKSSLISALFRLAKVDGLLSIDGIDTSKIILEQLRSKISIIPQEPILFNASLRNNIDPLNESDDASIWSALQDVELSKTFVTLDHPIESGGGNLSLGQRQLVCLARAIVKENKILILDEATGSVDMATDALIQKTIRTRFQSCTVLTIAHRLNTVIDSDKVLVMDNGQIAEFDTPSVLMSKNDSYFSKMLRLNDNKCVRLKCC